LDLDETMTVIADGTVETTEETAATIGVIETEVTSAEATETAMTEAKLDLPQRPSETEARLLLKAKRLRPTGLSGSSTQDAMSTIVLVTPTTSRRTELTRLFCPISSLVHYVPLVYEKAILSESVSI
jgi:hypothetical protein